MRFLAPIATRDPGEPLSLETMLAGLDEATYARALAYADQEAAALWSALLE